MTSEQNDTNRPIHLIVQYYRAATPERQAEIDTCLRENLQNPLIAEVHLLTEEDFALTEFPNLDKICQIVIGERLTYERAFRYANEWPEPVIWILSNADIYFDDTLRFLSSVDFKNQFFALTRHNVMPDGSLQFMPPEYAHGSQDAWIFTVPVPLGKAFTSFCLGLPGCDNKLVYELVKSGIKITNPSRKIIIRHLDLSRQSDMAKRVSEYFNMTSAVNIASGAVAPTPYLGEIYPTDRIDLANSKEYEMYYHVLQDFAEHVHYIDELRKQVRLLDHQVQTTDQQMQEKDKQIRERDEQITALVNSMSWRLTRPVRSVISWLIQEGSLRAVFFSLLMRMFKEPREFFRTVTIASVRDFLRLIFSCDPKLLGKLVNDAIDRQRAEISEEIGCDDYLLTLETRDESERFITPQRESVDVVVPIYNAHEVTEACISSVLSNTENCRLILIDDASPDERVKEVLDKVESIPERGIEVVVKRNSHNLGFVKTVNYSLTLTTGHFIILNSDTEVPPGWLDRLIAPILAAPDSIASVTPFSNAGIACSFPEPDIDQPLYKGLSLSEIDRFFRSYGSTDPIDIFTGVGFCMAFNRGVVERIGLFDEATFGKGYGEEADWSIRAYEAGFRNVLISNLFVYHKHGASFGQEEKKKLLEANLAKFWKRHRKHELRYRELAAKDPIRAVRDAVAVAVDAKTKGDVPRVAILDVDLIGGGTVYSAWLARELRQAGIEIAHFKYNCRQHFLKIHIESGSLSKNLVMPKTAAEKLSLLFDVLGIDFVVVNELFSWHDPKSVMQQLACGRIPYISMVHDFFQICPSWFLMNREGNFCDIPEDLLNCSECLTNNVYSGHKDLYGSDLDDVSAWRTCVNEFLNRAVNVTFFSRTTASYFDRVYPQLSNQLVLEHAIPNRERFTWQQRAFSGSGNLNLAVIGNLNQIKGERVIMDLIDSAEFEQLPVTLKVFGQSPLYPAGYRSKDGKVVFLGGYRQEELPELLEREGIHIILIPSILPETFSYTSSEAILLGYPVICFDYGAQAERVRRNQCGIICEDISKKDLLDAIRSILSKPEVVAEFSKNARNYVSATPDEHFGVISRLINHNFVNRRQT